MALGYKITEQGQNLLGAYVQGWELLWIPRVNYERLAKMALVLNKISFYSKDGYFSVVPQECDEQDLIALRALENDGYITRDILPDASDLVARQDFLHKNPGMRGLFRDL